MRCFIPPKADEAVPFGTVSYAQETAGWYVCYAGDTTKHGPFPSKSAAIEYQTTPCDRPGVET